MKKHWFRISLIAIIAFGLMLSPIFTIVYRCHGEEVMPVYYGSPFVFKMTDLGTSLSYFHHWPNTILNTLIWSLGIFLVDELLRRVLPKMAKRIIYPIVVILGLLITSYEILGLGVTGHCISPDSRSWDIEQEEETWNVECEPEFNYFGFIRNY